MVSISMQMRPNKDNYQVLMRLDKTRKNHKTLAPMIHMLMTSMYSKIVLKPTDTDTAGVPSGDLTTQRQTLELKIVQWGC